MFIAYLSDRHWEKQSIKKSSGTEINNEAMLFWNRALEGKISNIWEGIESIEVGFARKAKSGWCVYQSIESFSLLIASFSSAK